MNIEVTEQEFETIIIALEDSTYWRSAPRYRRDGFAHEPFSDDEEEAANCAVADNLRDKLHEQKRRYDGPE